MSNMVGPDFYSNGNPLYGLKKIKISPIANKNRADTRIDMMNDESPQFKNRQSLNSRRVGIPSVKGDLSIPTTNKSEDKYFNYTKFFPEIKAKDNYKAFPSAILKQDKLVESLQSEIRQLKSSLKAKDETITFLLSKFFADASMKSNLKCGNEVQPTQVASTRHSQSPVENSVNLIASHVHSPKFRPLRRNSMRIRDAEVPSNDLGMRKNHQVAIPIEKMKKFFKRLQNKGQVL